MGARLQGAAQVLTAVEGIYKDGEVKLLEHPAGLREARVVVTFLPTTSATPSREAAHSRLIHRMRTGIDLGGPPYPKREEIHERGRKT